MNRQTAQVWLLPLAAVIWNQSVYYGGNFLARNFPHQILELEIDHLIPFLPWTVSIYLGCFLYWALCYIMLARQERSEAYRFFCADFLAKGVCLIFFLLLPTTNLRPPVPGSGLWDHLMRFVYQVDSPTNLFPSIHCLVSWLCFIGIRRHQGLPRWAAGLSGIVAGLICLSTLTTRQHVVVDALGGILLAEASYWAAGRTKILMLFSHWADRLIISVSHVQTTLTASLKWRN